MAGLKSNIEWKQWGKEDPLWSVAAWPNKHKNGAEPWAPEELYALGQSDWQEFIRQWKQYGVCMDSCLEIGCGAGRLTKHITASFPSVSAVDVSPDMILEAQKSIKNVDFQVSDGIRLPQDDSSMAAIFSTHVLQHLDSEGVGFAYFREFYRVLSEGGTLMIHLPLYEFPLDLSRVAILPRIAYSVWRSINDARAAIWRAMGMNIMRSTPYSITGLSRYLAAIGFRDVEFRIFPVKSNGHQHSFVFARKG